VICALKLINPPKRGFFRRVYVKLFGAKPYAVRSSVDGIEVLTIICEGHSYEQKRIKKRIRNLAGEHYKNVLLPRSIDLSPYVYPPDSSEYYITVIDETLKALVKASRVPPAQLSIVVADPDGKFKKLSDTAVMCASVVKIFTYNRGYEKFADKIYKEYGAVLLTGSNTALMQGCRIAVVPYAIAHELPFLSDTFVLTLPPLCRQTGLICTAYHLSVPYSFQKYFDKDCDPTAALYLLDKEKTVRIDRNRHAHSLTVNNVVYPLEKAAKLI